MSSATFEVRCETIGSGIHAFTVHGELDMSTAPELESSLEEAPASDGDSVVIDLSGCEFIDSTGIALIVRAWQRLDGGGESDGRLVLCCVNDQVRRLLKITGIESSIAIHDGRDEAVAELRS